MKLRYSKKITAIQERVRKLPRILNRKLQVNAYKNAVLFIRLFQDGIKNDNFGFKRLHPASITNKKQAGYAKPHVPLYGAGLAEKDSLINVFAIKKLMNGYQVYPRWAKHHESKLQLRQLLEIHENGALIRVTEKMRSFLHYIGIHLKRDTKIIRIPPRPARRKAYEKLLMKIKKDDPVKEIKKAIKKLIDEGREI